MLLLPIIVVAPIAKGKAMAEQNHLINLFSKEWEEKCRIAANKYGQLANRKIAKAEKWWWIKQLLKDMVCQERRKVARPQKISEDAVVESETLKERRKLDFHSQEWMDRCKAVTEKCAALDNMKISKAEKLRRTKQLLKELAFTDTKR